ncbi:MAG: hypothetical protein O9284_02025 [Steroidobacteraceae bacterium]|nr:hypothetical protein [Steroidobacteraceae bacterium]
MADVRRLAGGLALAVALWLLNAALTFHNAWPTPAVRLPMPPELSLELAAALLALAAWTAWRARRGAAPPAVAGLLAAVTLAFALGRYAEVTAPALYGRPVNLYWDAPHLGGVAQMLAEAAGPGLALLAVLGALLGLGLVGWLLRLAWARVLAGLATRTGRRAVAWIGSLALALGLADAFGHAPTHDWLRVATPVSATYVEQAQLILHAWQVDRAGDGAAAASAAEANAASTADAASADARAISASSLATSPDPRFHALGGDDVLLVFLESYGSIAWTDATLAARLAPERAALARAVEVTGRTAVSATVVAPTFGGNSWLSHLSLLVGREVRDPGTYARTMQGRGRTLVSDFARAGYRTVALMPGLRNPWPEGAYYGFDAILGAAAIDYRGPEFGWWRIPDQYALAKLDVHAGPAPRFVFFPTISSHAPFRPTPPYQPDWARLRSARPYGPEADAALARAPDWTNLAPAYGDSLAYALQWLAGYLERRADAPLTLVVIGDHQPPAAVGGPSDDWSVPVHVITRRLAAVDALRAAGFVPGLVPPRAALGRMHELRPRLLAAFRGRGAAAIASVPPPGVDVAGRTALPAAEQPAS